jgi:5S rRNA maturation endonuclease (ribonuclease M5)
MPEDGGAGCPILIEGLKDVKALRALGFIGPIEKMNRGWDRSRLVAFLHDEYGTRNIIDGGPPIILLMDWDRTGGRLQTALRNRLQALDVPIDENLRNVLMKAMKPEGRTVESLAPFASSLMPLILARLEEE